ncbi:VCBS repeat-containing protein [Marinilongibacter aquaticus]|uniref:VCBS repeat-containing protein n=1 Tax=Marinilongibacter aquaticus TaxID=2975157 RepID=UPI0021BDD0DD|nr:VCBS repeat-containing protein [Marinilongibacter aquaticus]UBM60120.1 VCBS repeat-containing protein [Marinilongibacter aquaticus]
MKNNYFLRIFSGLGLFVLGLVGCQSLDDSKQESQEDGPRLFTLLTPSQTHINFQNTLTQGPNTNILMYEYFYNGGGVATADFNNDGLEDLYFTSNMGDNKLYLNNGNFQFNDITIPSGAGGRPGPWKTGVSVVDVNADGFQDIYLCYSGAMPAAKRVNQLFINKGPDSNGVPHFVDEATAYGLASTAFSNQAFFLDADRDGDLDMLLLNHNPKNLPILDEKGTQELLAEDSEEMGLRYFAQHDGKFTDETEKAGINSSPLSYGLGLAVADLNNDGWPDFYVSNDYAVPDYLYINQKNGHFRNELSTHLGHISASSMGSAVADINNDGQSDIYTLDMLPEDNLRQKLLVSPDSYEKFDLHVRSGFYYQYMRNMLHLNNGNNTFSEVGQQFGVSNTDWSWAALLADYDNDGWKDLYITNGYFKDFTNQDFIKYMSDFVEQRGRLQRQDVLEIIKSMPSTELMNYMYVNRSGEGFANRTETWGFSQTANSNGAAYADLDNDGDLDLVVNNINQAAFVYRNEAKGNYLKIKLKGPKKNADALGAKVVLKHQGQIQLVDQQPMRGYLSTVSKNLHFGLGEIERVDTLEVWWPDGKFQLLTDVEANRNLTLNYEEAFDAPREMEAKEKPIYKEVAAGIDFSGKNREKRDFDRQLLLNNELSFEAPSLASGDVNGDGLEDIFVGGDADQASVLYMQQASGRFVPKENPYFSMDKASSDVFAQFVDIDKDGDLDLYVCSGGYHDFSAHDTRLQDRLYFNDGLGNFSKNKVLPEMQTASAVAAFADINGDGRMDIFVGGRTVPGKYPESPRSYLLIQDAQGNFQDKTLDIAPELGYLGMVTDAKWADLNADQQMELVLVGEFLPITVFEKNEEQWKIATDKFFSRNYSGWWNCLEIEDIDGDGILDILAGNMGLNTQFVATEKEPVDLFYGDFDGNGQTDPILTFYIQGQSYPYLTRDELFAQMPRYKAKFKSFEQFAQAKISDILSDEEMEKAKHLRADFMQTALFLGDKSGSFKKVPLPAEAQYAPVYALQLVDFDRDGDKDIFMAGNISRTKLRFGQFDANYGQLFENQGQGRFHYVEQSRSGFNIWGDVRDVISIGDDLFIGRSGAALLHYKLLE